MERTVAPIARRREPQSGKPKKIVAVRAHTTLVQEPFQSFRWMGESKAERLQNFMHADARERSAQKEFRQALEKLVVFSQSQNREP
jgi:hypothetical protein